ncbi:MULTISPECIES: alpha/beta hydrolase [unclassified Novosphingobium]|uniref:alpha/beta hydrolase n=1 Tax=unclassified Novosphingobium TaxID=2644732 RepID=UPI001F46D809|nr:MULTISPECIES: alpha/beta hydrolase [unclassified Novosphingobium]
MKLFRAALAYACLIALPATADPFPQRPEPSAVTIHYGEDPLQDLDFWRAVGFQKAASLVLFVHGGGWKRGSKDNATGRFKAPHFTAEGYAFASIDYRLVPEATVEQQAQDVADALAALLAQADSLGIARGKVVLMGHSAGAHLVALVGTDPRYLSKAGLSYADIRGVIAVDGAAYDVPAQMTERSPIMGRTYAQAFGPDPARQRALSPTLQAAAANAPAFLLLHVQRPDGIRQAQALETALRKAGTAVERESFAGKGLQGHMEINRNLGDPAYPATASVDRWLARVFR